MEVLIIIELAVVFAVFLFLARLCVLILNII